MNKTAIKNFAVWARKKLIEDISYKARLLGVSDKEIAKALPQSTNDLKFFDIGTKDYTEVSGKEIKQREALISAIKTKERDTKNYKEAYEYIIEEVSYTWFNRLIAIRFMEVNEYLPSGIRVLSSENKAKNEPDFVTNPFEAELDLTIDEQEKIFYLKEQNKSDELFRMLFIKQCNKLHEILPDLFENTNDYSELLLTISFTDKDGIIYHLTHDIDEDDFNVEKEGQIEIIGWLYQYYILERRTEVISVLNKKSISKKDIPAATQLFTTDWVVRYMVDNSLGRYWIERNPNSKLVDKLQFFVTPKNGHISYVDEKVYPSDLTFFDPCMGSGHILVYAFDVLMEIYRECGYSDRDAASSIIENNLFGLDIDKRAYQLAYFAVMMKARQYNRRILMQEITNNLSVIEESNSINKFRCEGLMIDEEYNKIGEYLVQAYKNAQEIGTLQIITDYDYKSFLEYLLNFENNATPVNIFSSICLMNELPLMIKLVKQAIIMSKKFAVVCTNPPYMNKLENQLKKFVVDNYKAYSGDLFSVFIYRNFDYCKTDGYSAFMTPFVWMFIKTYENIRNYIINNKSIISLVQMEYSAFEEATVPICSFILQNSESTEKSLCFRLSDFKGGMEVQKQKVLEALNNKECGYFYEAKQSNFKKIPGSPIAYWVSDNLLKSYKNKHISNYVNCKSGIMTGSDFFIKLWYELEVGKIKFNCVTVNDMLLFKWFPLNSGGEFRKWYGNNVKVVNLWNEGLEIKTKVKNYRLRDSNFYFKHGITWGRITSSQIAFRNVIEGSLFGDAGPIGFIENKRFYVLGFLNSKIVKNLLQITNPTLNFQVRDIMELPLSFYNKRYNEIEKLVQDNVAISKSDWDSYETSWDFTLHPIMEYKTGSGYGTDINQWSYRVSDAYTSWKEICNERFRILKLNEEELNRIFIDIYGLQDELTPDVLDKDITVHRIFDTKDDIPESMKGSNYIRTKRDEIVSLISYAVGCIFGRYSLDIEGLAYAGGEWDISKYHTFVPNADNCIPITDEVYFEEDIVGCFEEFIRVAYGEDTLEENLDFIANALGNKGNTSREIIRNYFLKGFMKDHIKNYQKRPIYWLFDSGKQNGFKALVYMHRWDEDTIGHIRIEYLHRMQHIYEKEIERMQDIIDNSHNNKEVNVATKRKEKLQKQLKETKDYDTLIAHLALSRIDIDLDDGVKVNYEKVQTGIDGKKIQVLEKI